MRITTKEVKEIHVDSIGDCQYILGIVERFIKDNEDEEYYYRPHDFEDPDRLNWLDLQSSAKNIIRELKSMTRRMEG